MIIEAPNFHEDLEDFAAYIEETWVGSVARPAHFRPELWNVRQRTLDDEP